jgi:hypothetical protein
MNEKADRTEHVLVKQCERNTAGRSPLKAIHPIYDVDVKEEISNSENRRAAADAYP